MAAQYQKVTVTFQMLEGHDMIKLIFVFSLAGPTFAETTKSVRYEDYLGNTNNSKVWKKRWMEGIDFRGCDRYPYADPHEKQGNAKLQRDLEIALNDGISCMRKFPVHKKIGENLIKLLSDLNTKKTFNCQLTPAIGYAVSTPEKSSSKLVGAPYPGISLRLTNIGDVHPAYEDSVYSSLGLSLDEIKKNAPTPWTRNQDANHRVGNLPRLLFHEMLHWLGYKHNVNEVDRIRLYNYCCFGVGISKESNSPEFSTYQSEACKLMGRDDIWSGDLTRQKLLRANKDIIRTVQKIKIIDETN